MRLSTGLTPLQDAVLRIQHRTGPVARGCSSGLCLQMLGELVKCQCVDLTVCVENSGRQKLALEVALEGSMCDPARKFLQQEPKKNKIEIRPIDALLGSLKIAIYQFI